MASAHPLARILEEHYLTYGQYRYECKQKKQFCVLFF